MIAYLIQCVHRCKRTLYMGSLYMRLLGVAGTSRQDIYRCNRDLHLARRPDALRFPGMMATHIWKDPYPINLIREYIQSGKMEEAIELTLKETPDWIVYCPCRTKVCIRSDLRVVIRAVARKMGCDYTPISKELPEEAA